MTSLRDHLVGLPGPDLVAAAAVRERSANVLRPTRALARLDELAVWVAGWQATATPAIERPGAVVFAADHGVAANIPVSAYPSEVTAAMVSAFERGVSTMSVFARHVGADLEVVDVGVGQPTGDIRTEPALDPDRFDEVVGIAIEAVDRRDADLLVIGELGIGNTTAAAAVCAALLGGDVGGWIGRGSGVDDDGLQVKNSAVRAAVERVVDVDDPLEILRHVGGAELVAITAAMIAARRRRLPVVLDGYICTAAALPLHLAQPGALDHCVAGHRSAEPGHRRLLEVMDKPPLLQLDLRLGEGSGAMGAVPIIRLACAGVVEVETFDEFFGSDAQSVGSAPSGIGR